MTIADETGSGKSLTGWKRLDLFTDRRDCTRLFAEWLNEAPRNQILFFEGGGGNGKSLLLLYLRKHYCKKLDSDTWKHVRTLDDNNFASHFEETEVADVPIAELNFAISQQYEQFHRDMREQFNGLMSIYRQLKKHDFRFPNFVYALVRYYQQVEGKDLDEIKAVFPSEEATLIAKVFDAISGTSVGAVAKIIFQLSFKQVGKRWNENRLKKMADREILNEMLHWDPGQLSAELPRLFAIDLNSNLLDENDRVVLMFDSHEAFRGEHSERSMMTLAARLRRDAWLRNLLVNLDLENGIVIAVAGRNKPDWEKAHFSNFQIPLSYIYFHQIGFFRDSDADAYLQLVEINSPQMRRELITFAAIDDDKIHPLYLGLSADVVLAARSQGIDLTPEDFSQTPGLSEKGQVLMERLLNNVDSDTERAVWALSACRSFDFSIYEFLGKSLHYSHTRSSFKNLTDFSFVWRSGDSFQIHGLLRRILNEGLPGNLSQLNGEDIVSETHRQLAAHYSDLSKTSPGLTADFVYHQSRSTPEEGCEIWVKQFDQALDHSNFDICRDLLGVRNDLQIVRSSDIGRLSFSEGQFYSMVAEYDQAREKFREVIAAYDQTLQLVPNDLAALNNKGNALASLADLWMRLSEHEQAKSDYAESIAAYDQILKLHPDDVRALNNKGNALQSLADLRMRLSEHTQAKTDYANSIAAFNQVLQLVPNDVITLSNKGNVLGSLAELWTRLSEHKKAKTDYTKSIAAYDQALQLAPNDVGALINKGAALQSLAQLRTQLSEHEQAKTDYANSIAAYDKWLQVAPNDVRALSNKGNALASLADLWTRLSEYEQAKSDYIKSIAAYDQALQIAPNDVRILKNKGVALANSAELWTQLFEHERAKIDYAKSIAAFDQVLQLASDDFLALNNKSISLHGLAKLRMQPSEHEQAKTDYAESIAACDQALRITPDDVSALNNKGNALQSLAILRTQLFEHEQAKDNYTESIAAYDQALHIAENDVRTLNNKGNALQSLAYLRIRLSEHEQAKTDYHKAIAAYDQALQLAPNDVRALNNKGGAFLSLAKLRTQLSEHEQAKTDYANSIAACDQALRIAPNAILTLNTKGNALLDLAQLRAYLSENEQAKLDFRNAIVVYSLSLKVGLNQKFVRKSIEYCERRLQELG